MLSNEYGYTSILAPVAPHPANQNAILCFDLRQDPEPLIERSVDELRRLIFAPSEELSLEESRIRLIPIHINRSPVLAPLSTLDPDTAKRLGLDVTLCGKRAAKLAEASLLTQKIMEVFRRDEAEIRRDPELEIYSGGFFSDADRQRMERFRELSPEAMLKRRGDFYDRRLPELAWRFVCRNHSEILDENERKKWKSFCAGRLLFPPERLINDFAFFKRKVKELSGDTNLPAGDKKIIKKARRMGDDHRSRCIELRGVIALLGVPLAPRSGQSAPGSAFAPVLGSSPRTACGALRLLNASVKISE